jgi:hypothetical protein
MEGVVKETGNGALSSSLGAPSEDNRAAYTNAYALCRWGITLKLSPEGPLNRNN